MSRIPFPALALAVCLVFAAVGVAAVDEYGISTDEPFQRNMTAANAYYLTGDRDAITVLIPAEYERFYGIAFELPLLAVEWALGLQDWRSIFLSRHLLTHLFFIAGGFCSGLLVWRMFGSRRLALLAMLLFLLHPRLYAHSFFNSKDIAFLVMFVIALYLMHRAFRRDTLGAFVLLGIVVALAANMRPFALMLIPATLAMLGLDWWQSPGEQRKRILLTGGVFAATALLTIYVSHPYYWENPLRFIEGLQTASRYPKLIYNLFQGQIVGSDAIPPHYIPVWFGITAPPLALLLGILGAAAVCWRALRTPRQALRRGELRFCLLLLGCFALPVAVVIILQSIIYDGWRQMYFLWAPFCLLAVAGGRYIALYMRDTLIPALIPGNSGGGIRYRNLWQAAMYAAAIAMVGSAAYAIVSLHPYQQVYFNPLVDRETPERLQGQYDMEYWGVAHRKGLEYLLRRYPEMPLRFSDHWKNSHNALLIPEAERQRLFFVSQEQADFHIADDRDISFNTGEPPGAVLHTIKVYNNTILTVTARESIAAGPEALAELYRSEQQSIAVGDLLAAGEFNVHLSQDRANLVYAKSGCTLADMQTRFYLDLIPLSEKDLPRESVPRGYEYYEYQEFGFREFGFYDGQGIKDEGWCATQTPLPDYPLARIRAGQYIITRSEPERLWGVEIPEIYWSNAGAYQYWQT